MYLFRSIAIFICVCIFKPSFTIAQDAAGVTQKMLSTVKCIHSIIYTSDLKERIKGKLNNAEKGIFKINSSPYKLYMYQLVPTKGLECLYVAGANDGKIKVNPAAFPWVNLNLAPEGDLMLQNRHHSIYDAGFTYTASILEYLMQKYHNPKNLVLNGQSVMLGSNCYYLTFYNPEYKLVKYTTQANETPLTIAKKMHLNFYSILENNPKLKITSTIDAGTVLTIPNDYSSKMEMYVHVDKYYPVCIRVYDNKGLFEEYTFYDVTLNPVFTNNDFSEDNPKYGF
jgi:hypothetical protein